MRILINRHQAHLSRYFALAIFILFFALPCLADEEPAPPQIGNFSVSSSQQPGPLVSFGENILKKNETRLFLFADDYVGVNEHQIDVIPSVMHGITDNFTLGLNVPYAASYQLGSQKSTGFEDASVQLEYAFYNKSTTRYVDQATVVINAAAPTGSIYKSPPTGSGSPSLFLGATYNRTYVDWFVFGSPGATFTTAKNGTKFGNSYLYQLGFGRNIASAKGWVFAWMNEFDGTYSQKNRVFGLINPNSGGNIIYMTPSLWISTESFVFQLGAGFPVTQHLFGNQPRETGLFVANAGWAVG
jgi:hypothetical protein